MSETVYSYPFDLSNLYHRLVLIQFYPQVNFIPLLL